MRHRVVLDTNVVVSGLLFSGPPRSILTIALSGAIEIVTCEALNAELERVLRHKFPETEPAIRETLEALRDLAILIDPGINLSFVTDDPDDNRVLECAVGGRAHSIVSGDNHLLTLKSFHNIPILTPREFLRHSQFPKKAN